VRILAIAAAYPSPSEPERAVYLESLHRGLREAEAGRRIEVTVVAPRVRAEDPGREERDGIRVLRFPYPGGGRRLKELQRPSALVRGAYAMSAARALLEAARDHGADVILCHWLLPAGPSAALAARALHAPLVVVAHGSDVNTYAESSLLHLGASRVVIHRASAIVAASTALGEAISERLTGTPRPVDVIPMGVDERFFGAPARRVERRAAREQLGIRPDARLLLFVGDLTESKGVPELLAAHRTLLERGLDCDLALVGAHGPGSERALTDGVRSSSSSAAPLRVLAPGAVPQRDLVAWYRAADLFVLPSHAEGSPVSLMEALSCGLPAVASNVGGIPELIAWGRNGWLVPPREPRILADTLAGLLGDPTALEHARRALEIQPPDFSAGSRAKELFAVLQRALGETPRAPIRDGAPRGEGAQHALEEPAHGR